MTQLPRFTVVTTDSDNDRYIKNSFYDVSFTENYNYSSNLLHSVIRQYLVDLLDPPKTSFDSYPIHALNSSNKSIHDIISFNCLDNYFSTPLLENSRKNLYHALSKSSHIDLTKTPLFFNLSLKHGYSYSYNDVLTQCSEYSKAFAFTENTDVNPTSLRYFSSNNVMYVERPPFKANVHFKPVKASANAKEIESYEIWVPWTLTKIQIRNDVISDFSFSIYFSSSSLTDTSSNQYAPCMFPNSYNDGRICFSSSLEEIPALDSQSIRYLYSVMINEYVSGGWNLDLGLPVVQTPPQTISDTYSEYRKPTHSSLSKRFPDLTASKISTLINQCYSTTHSSHSKYFFKMMSSFTLEETLDFYSSYERYSLDHISSRASRYDSYHEDMMSAVRSRSNYYNVTAQYNDTSSLDKQILFIVFNHKESSDLSQDPQKLLDSFYNLRISGTWSNTTEFNESIFSILHDNLSKIMNMEENFIYIYYDHSSKEYEIHSTTDASFDRIISLDIISNMLIADNSKEISL